MNYFLISIILSFSIILLVHESNMNFYLANSQQPLHIKNTTNNTNSLANESSLNSTQSNAISKYYLGYNYEDNFY